MSSYEEHNQNMIQILNAELDKPKFALFASSTFEPAGGWEDHVGTFDSLDGAYDRYNQGKNGRYRWGHVVNLNSSNIVAKYY